MTPSTLLKILAAVAVLVVLFIVGCAVWRSRGPDRNLIRAVNAADLAAATAALQAGADANARDALGVPVLALAASRQADEIAEALIANGADVNAVVHAPSRGLNRSPVLVLPAANGSLSTVNFLLGAGARIDAADGTGLTALMSAAFMGHSDILATLLAQGASIEQVDQSGYTALMYACNAGHTAAVQVLLAAGANPHAADNQRSTPLMFAAQHGHDEIVSVLLQHGADPTRVGSYGLSAIGFAKQNHHASTLRLLYNPPQTSH